MKMKDFFGEKREIRDIITDLKRCKEPLHIPSWEELEKQYDPKKHRIRIDQEFWKDRGTKRKPKKVARVTYGMQKMYTRRMVQYAFTIPVKRMYKYDKKKWTKNGVDEMKEVISSIESVYDCVHINSINLKRWQFYYASCELLTIWYAVDSEPHSKYGFVTDKKLRCKSYSSMNGYDLYPIFDDFDDLIGLCIEYRKDEYENNLKTQITYFEVFTPEVHLVFRRGKSGDWLPYGEEEAIMIGKLPLAYEHRNEPIWEDQTSNNDEIELSLSRESEILRDNSAPLVKVSGQMKNASSSKPDSKGSTLSERALQAENDELRKEMSSSDGRRFVITENGGDVQYVTWSQSIEAMKYYISELKKNSDEIVQLPSLSLDNVKGLGALSGEARQTLVIDGHLKVGEEKGDAIMFFEREFSVICAYMAILNPDYKERLQELKCEHVITPFTFKDEDSNIERWSRACGDKALLTRKTAIAKSGLVEDAEQECKAIEEEERESARMTAIGTLLNETDEE